MVWQHIISFGSVCAWGASQVCVFLLVHVLVLTIEWPHSILYFHLPPGLPYKLLQLQCYMCLCPHACCFLYQYDSWLFHHPNNTLWAVLTHPWRQKQPQKTQWQICKNEDDVLQQTFLCIQMINFMIYLHAICTIPFNHFYTHLTSVFLTLQLHICDIISQCYVFLCWIPPWRWPNKAKTHKRLAIRLYTFVYNCCAGVGINIVQIKAGLQIIKLAINTNSFLHHPVSKLHKVSRVKYSSHHPVLLS